MNEVEIEKIETENLEESEFFDLIAKSEGAARTKYKAEEAIERLGYPEGLEKGYPFIDHSESAYLKIDPPYTISRTNSPNLVEIEAKVPNFKIGESKLKFNYNFQEIPLRPALQKINLKSLLSQIQVGQESEVMNKIKIQINETEEEKALAMSIKIYNAAKNSLNSLPCEDGYLLSSFGKDSKNTDLLIKYFAKNPHLLSFEAEAQLLVELTEQRNKSIEKFVTIMKAAPNNIT